MTTYSISARSTGVHLDTIDAADALAAYQAHMARVGAGDEPTDAIPADIAVEDAPFHWWPATREQYEEALNVLPPVAWDGSSFCVGEPWDHHAVSGRPRFQAYRQRGCTFERSSRPITVAELRASRGEAVD